MKNRILLEYSLLSLLFTSAVAVLLAGFLVRQTSGFALDQHTSFIIEYFDSITENYPELADSLENDREPHGHDVDHFARDLFLFPSITHLRITGGDGDVLWELERGDHIAFEPPEEDSHDASRSGVIVHIQGGDASLEPALHIIYPYRLGGETIAFIEVIDTDQLIHQHLRETRRLTFFGVGASGAALYVLLFLSFYRSYRRLRQTNRRLEKTQEVTIRTMSRLAELRDSDTGTHIERTSRYCGALAEELRKSRKYSDYINDHYIEDLRRSAPLHDIGKVGIPDAILNKPGPLDEQEWEQMRQHPVYGARIIEKAAEELDFQSYLEMGIQVVKGHHENWDGTGYPEGLAGTAIPLSARIMALADIYDALRTWRPYKEPISHEKARDILREEKGRKLDPDIVEAFFTVEDEFRRIAETV